MVLFWRAWLLGVMEDMAGGVCRLVPWEGLFWLGEFCFISRYWCLMTSSVSFLIKSCLSFYLWCMQVIIKHMRGLRCFLAFIQTVYPVWLLWILSDSWPVTWIGKHGVCLGLSRWGLYLRKMKSRWEVCIDGYANFGSVAYQRLKWPLLLKETK